MYTDKKNEEKNASEKSRELKAHIDRTTKAIHRISNRKKHSKEFKDLFSSSPRNTNNLNSENTPSTSSIHKDKDISSSRAMGRAINRPLVSTNEKGDICVSLDIHTTGTFLDFLENHVHTQQRNTLHEERRDNKEEKDNSASVSDKRGGKRWKGKEKDMSSTCTASSKNANTKRKKTPLNVKTSGRAIKRSLVSTTAPEKAKTVSKINTIRRPPRLAAVKNERDPSASGGRNTSPPAPYSSSSSFANEERKSNQTLTVEKLGNVSSCPDSDNGDQEKNKDLPLLVYSAPLGEILTYISSLNPMDTQFCPTLENAEDLSFSRDPEPLSRKYIERIMCEAYGDLSPCMSGEKCICNEKFGFVMMKYVAPSVFDASSSRVDSALVNYGIASASSDDEDDGFCYLCHLYIVGFCYTRQRLSANVCSRIDLPFYHKVDIPGEYKQDAMLTPSTVSEDFLAIKPKFALPRTGMENSCGLTKPFRSFSTSDYRITTREVKVRDAVGVKVLRIQCLEDCAEPFITHPVCTEQLPAVRPFSFMRTRIHDAPDISKALTFLFSNCRNDSRARLRGSQGGAERTKGRNPALLYQYREYERLLFNRAVLRKRIEEKTSAKGKENTQLQKEHGEGEALNSLVEIQELNTEETLKFMKRIPDRVGDRKENFSGQHINSTLTKRRRLFPSFDTTHQSKRTKRRRTTSEGNFFAGERREITRDEHHISDRLPSILSDQQRTILTEKDKDDLRAYAESIFRSNYHKTSNKQLTMLLPAYWGYDSEERMKYSNITIGEFKPFPFHLMFEKSLLATAEKLEEILECGRIDLNQWLPNPESVGHTDNSLHPLGIRGTYNRGGGDCTERFDAYKTRRERKFGRWVMNIHVDLSKPLSHYSSVLHHNAYYRERRLFVALIVKLKFLETLSVCYPNSKHSENDHTIHERLNLLLEWNECYLEAFLSDELLERRLDSRDNKFCNEMRSLLSQEDITRSDFTGNQANTRLNNILSREKSSCFTRCPYLFSSSTVCDAEALRDSTVLMKSLYRACVIRVVTNSELPRRMFSSDFNILRKSCSLQLRESPREVVVRYIRSALETNQSDRDRDALFAEIAEGVWYGNSAKGSRRDVLGQSQRNAQSALPTLLSLFGEFNDCTRWIERDASDEDLIWLVKECCKEFRLDCYRFEDSKSHASKKDTTHVKIEESRATVDTREKVELKGKADDKWFFDFLLSLSKTSAKRLCDVWRKHYSVLLSALLRVGILSLLRDDLERSLYEKKISLLEKHSTSALESQACKYLSGYAIEFRQVKLQRVVSSRLTAHRDNNRKKDTRERTDEPHSNRDECRKMQRAKITQYVQEILYNIHLFSQSHNDLLRSMIEFNACENNLFLSPLYIREETSASSLHYQCQIENAKRSIEIMDDFSLYSGRSLDINYKHLRYERAVRKSEREQLSFFQHTNDDRGGVLARDANASSSNTSTSPTFSSSRVIDQTKYVERSVEANKFLSACRPLFVSHMDLCYPADNRCSHEGMLPDLTKVLPCILMPDKSVSRNISLGDFEKPNAFRSSSQTLQRKGKSNVASTTDIDEREPNAKTSTTHASSSGVVKKTSVKRKRKDATAKSTSSSQISPQQLTLQMLKKLLPRCTHNRSKEQKHLYVCDKNSSYRCLTLLCLRLMFIGAYKHALHRSSNILHSLTIEKTFSFNNDGKYRENSDHEEFKSWQAEHHSLSILALREMLLFQIEQVPSYEYILHSEYPEWLEFKRKTFLLADNARYLHSVKCLSMSDIARYVEEHTKTPSISIERFNRHRYHLSQALKTETNKENETRREHNIQERHRVLCARKDVDPVRWFFRFIQTVNALKQLRGETRLPLPRALHNAIAYKVKSLRCFDVVDVSWLREFNFSTTDCTKERRDEKRQRENISIESIERVERVFEMISRCAPDYQVVAELLSIEAKDYELVDTFFSMLATHYSINNTIKTDKETYVRNVNSLKRRYGLRKYEKLPTLACAVAFTWCCLSKCTYDSKNNSPFFYGHEMVGLMCDTGRYICMNKEALTNVRKQRIKDKKICDDLLEIITNDEDNLLLSTCNRIVNNSNYGKERLYYNQPLCGDFPISLYFAPGHILQYSELKSSPIMSVINFIKNNNLLLTPLLDEKAGNQHALERSVTFSLGHGDISASSSGARKVSTSKRTKRTSTTKAKILGKDVRCVDYATLKYVKSQLHHSSIAEDILSHSTVPITNSFSICDICGSLSGFSTRMYSTNGFTCMSCNIGEMRKLYTPSCINCHQRLSIFDFGIDGGRWHCYDVIDDLPDSEIGDMRRSKKYVCARCHKCITSNYNREKIIFASEFKASKLFRETGVEAIINSRDHTLFTLSHVKKLPYGARSSTLLTETNENFNDGSDFSYESDIVDIEDKESSNNKKRPTIPFHQFRRYSTNGRSTKSDSMNLFFSKRHSSRGEPVESREIKIFLNCGKKLDFFSTTYTGK